MVNNNGNGSKLIRHHTTRTETYSRGPIMFMIQLDYFTHTVL